MVAAAHGNTEIVQRGSVLLGENVNQTNLSGATDWMLHEQVMILQYLNAIYVLYGFSYDIVFSTISVPVNTK